MKVGGWSQARYQRRVQNAHSNHAKEVVETLGKVVKQDQIQYIVIAGDPQITSVLTEEMPKELADKVVDTLRLDIKASDQQVFEVRVARHGHFRAGQVHHLEVFLERRDFDDPALTP